MNNIIIAVSIAGIAGIAIAVSMTVGFSTNNPWDGMTCEEMMNLAMSPGHQTFTEQQHMQFHMKLAPCIENMNNMHP